MDNLESENLMLKQIIREILPLARRYAHNRSTYAPHIVNEAIDDMEKIGITIEDDIEIGKYCDDGMFGKWNKDRGCFEKEN